MDINTTLENLRTTYRSASLDVKDCDSNPEYQFDKWLEEAIQGHCDEPNAFVLSTIEENKPRARVVLLKGIHKSRFVFYTNYLSSKGHEIQKNPHVSMTFLWLPLHRQVRIEGILSKVEPGLSDNYFQKRPRGSQLGAIASPQSRKMGSREELEELFKEAEKKLSSNLTISRPPHWGGYGLIPDYFEFWQGRDNRLHDRIIYEKNNSAWNLGRLAP